MKKTFVTLATVAALVATSSAVLANNNATGAHNKPNTSYDYVVENLGLKISTLKAYADAAKVEFDSVTLNVTGREATLAATKEDLKAAQDDVAAKKAEKDYTIGLLNVGTPVEGFNDVTSAINFYDGEIAKLEGVVTTRETAVAVAQEDLNNWVAKKAEAAAKLEKAKADLDAAIAEALNAGLTPEQVEQAKAGAPVAPAANNGGAKSVAPAKTATGSKTLPKTSAAK
ncbi:TPA: hypothetical protein ACGOU1_002102 [Streptococcus suis]|nr:hypothetical protein [Streptococcus suis]